VAVAKFAWGIRCDDDHYAPVTRERALDLWFMAVQLLRSLEKRGIRYGPRMTFAPRYELGVSTAAAKRQLLP
jgi:hypothetical protein